MKNKSLIIVLSVLIIGGSVYLAGEASAQTNSKTFVEAIAEKFNLNKDEVQKTADDFRTQKQSAMKSERKARLEQNLNEAVTEGKITESQKQAILKKHEEMQVQREQHHEEMQKWAAENGIDGLGTGFGLGKMGRGMHFWK